MKHRQYSAAIAVLLACSGALHAQVNATPYEESFEAYSNGFRIAEAYGWSAVAPEATVVTTDTVATAGLAPYVAANGAPIEGAHAKVLSFATAVSNRVQSLPGQQVRVDVLVRPWLCPETPPDFPSAHAGVSFGTNGLPSVYLRDIGSGSNRWQELTNAPPIASGDWVRVTVLHDYDHGLYQVAFHGGAPVEDAAGQTGPGGRQPGTWFVMPQTNGTLSNFKVEGSGVACLDDLSVVGERPVVTTWPVTNVTASSADLTGYLSFTGLAQTAVAVYWGPSDGGTNPTQWAGLWSWPLPQAKGGYRHHVSGLSSALHFCRYAASNAFGAYWATNTETFLTGAVTATTTDTAAGERPLDSGTFRVQRPAASTNGPLRVYFELQGTAQNGVDYRHTGNSVVIPVGAASADITITPLVDAAAEGTETVVLVLRPGAYVIGEPPPVPIQLADAPVETKVWDNGSGDANWNTTSANWSSDLNLFYPGDIARFTGQAPGRIYVGNALWNSGLGTWDSGTPVDMQVSRVVVVAGEYELEGGAVTGGPLELRGGRLIDRNPDRAGFGDGAVLLKGGAFWRQIPPDLDARSQVFTNELVVEGVSELTGCRGETRWQGNVTLKSRLNIGINTTIGHVSAFTGAITVNQDTNFTVPRILALLDGGGTAYLDGPIVGDTHATHTGAFPLTLGVGPAAGDLHVRGTNTYGSGTVIANLGSATHGVVVEAGASLGTGPVTVQSNAVMTLVSDAAIAGTQTLVTVRDGGSLVLRSGRTIADDARLVLEGAGAVTVATGLSERVGRLVIGGAELQPGLYTGRDYPQNIRGNGSIRVGRGMDGGVLIIR